MGKSVDITGKQYNRLTVISFAYRKSNNVVWLCQCSCGRQTHTTKSKLESGHTVSCGCYHSEELALRNNVHGKYGTAEYNTWLGIKKRCNNPESSRYKYYGGKGIEVCSQWDESFETFLKDMGLMPGKEYEIDRRDNLGNYEPGNCRWVTRSQNMANTGIKSTNRSGYKGVDVIKGNGKFRAQISINKKKISLGYYDDPITAAKAYDIAAEKYHGEFAATNKSLGML